MVHLDNEILFNTKKKPIQLELPVAVSHPTRHWDPTQVLYKSSSCS